MLVMPDMGFATQVRSMQGHSSPYRHIEMFRIQLTAVPEAV